MPQITMVMRALNSIVDEGPRVRSVEAANAHGGNQRRIEVAEVHALLRPRAWLEWLPMRDAPTGSAVNMAQGSVSPDVLPSGFRMAFDLDRTELIVDPRSTNAATQRAVASGGYLGRRR